MTINRKFLRLRVQRRAFLILSYRDIEESKMKDIKCEGRFPVAVVGEGGGRVLRDLLRSISMGRRIHDTQETTTHQTEGV